MTSSSDSSSDASCEAAAALAAASALGFLAGGPALAAAFLAAASLAAACLAAWAAAAAAFSSSACREQARGGLQHSSLMQHQRHCMALCSLHLGSTSCSIVIAKELTANAESGAGHDCASILGYTSLSANRFQTLQTPKAPDIWHIKPSPSFTLRFTSSSVALPSLGTVSRSIASQSSAPSLSDSSAAGAAAASCRGSSDSSLVDRRDG